MGKIAVTKTMDGKHWMMFEEADVRKACALEKCNPEMMEGCIANMKEFTDDCTTCYITLINDIKATPEYRKIPPEIEV